MAMTETTNTPKCEPPPGPFAGSRRIAMIAVGVAILALLLLSWMQVKDRLFVDRPSPVADPPSTQRTVQLYSLPAALPIVNTGGLRDASPSRAATWQLGQTWTNSIGIKLAYAPAGEFVSEAETRRATISGRPAAPTPVGKAFLIGTTEVTQSQWRSVMGTSPWSDREGAMTGDDFPANYVTWDDAAAFCKKLSDKEGKNYRLPTRSEWEYACRGGTSSQYSFGGYDERSRLGDFAWYDENAGNTREKYPHRVALKRANPWNLYDMHGNVSEWCADLHKPTGTIHMFCGGSWLDSGVACTSGSVLHGVKDDTGRLDVGFRLCADVAGIPAPSNDERPASGEIAVDADRPGVVAQPARGLQRVGYFPDQCLICTARRTAAAKASCSDRKGFGLCEDCGSKYLAWAAVLPRLQDGRPLGRYEQRVAEDFKAVISANSNRGASVLLPGFTMFFFTGKFATHEWDVLMGGD
jgi:formylglycine-generating enzyme required for sulfatase activity